MIVLLVFVLGFVLSAVLSAVVRRAATARGAMVPARADHWHQHPTPTFGGIAMATATFGVALGLMARDGRWAGLTTAVLVTGASLVMFVVGLVEERLQLTPLAKLVAALTTGSFLLFGLPAISGVSLPWWQTVIAIIWYAGVAHAFNLLDNMDGLAGGVALLPVACLLVVFRADLDPLMVAVLTAFAGSVAGFLAWNLRPARLFMGDCGSLFLGSMLAGASLAVLHRPGAAVGIEGLAISLVLLVPLFDTSFVLVLRRLAGRPASRGGTDDLSHRLVSVGLSERSAVAVLYMLSLSGGACAFLVHRRGPWPFCSSLVSCWQASIWRACPRTTARTPRPSRRPLLRRS